MYLAEASDYTTKDELDIVQLIQLKVNFQKKVIIVLLILYLFNYPTSKCF